MASACSSPSWPWRWCRWASRRCSTWCLALCSPASPWRCGARSCRSSGLEVDLWWIPVSYERLLRNNKKKQKKTKKNTNKKTSVNNTHSKVNLKLSNPFKYFYPSNSFCFTVPPLPSHRCSFPLFYFECSSLALRAQLSECHCRYPLWVCFASTFHFENT